MLLTALQAQTIRSEFASFVRRAKPPRLRTMREFAEQEIIIPDGPFQGRKFNTQRQPYAARLLDAIDSQQWIRCFVTGPTQSGKTLTSFVIPIMYHLFEMGETVIVGLPTEEMASDKWEIDLKPVIEAGRYRDQLPTSGKGSRSGTATLITFRNGARLRFMSGGGGDKKRAGFTSRVLVMTEIDGFDEQGGKSRESDKITQLEERTRAYGARRRIYGECTVSLDTGRIWQEYQNGTASRLLLLCPHCGNWVTPEREHLKGYDGAESEVEAKEQTHFACPDCEAAWSEIDRRSANENSRLIHRGQELTAEGEITGPPAATQTLGFRWSAVNNMFLTSGDYGVDEWKARKEEDEENAEKKMRQFVWALPYEPKVKEFAVLTVEGITRRISDYDRGEIPEGVIAVSAGVDVGKWLHWFCVIGWVTPVDGFVLDYGAVDVPSAHMDEEKAIVAALRQIRDEKLQPYRDSLKACWIDSGYKNEAIYAFCRESGLPYWPSKGFGAGEKGRKYNSPDPKTKGIEFVAEHYHGKNINQSGVVLIDADADHCKSTVHNRLSIRIEETEMEQGTLQLFQARPQEHLSYAKHILAERKISEWTTAGEVIRWENPQGKANHLLDATGMACGAGDMAVSIAQYRPQAAAESTTQRMNVRKMNRR